MFSGLRDRLKALERRRSENPLPREGTHKRLVYDLFGTKPHAPGAQLIEGLWYDVERWETETEKAIAMIEADAARMQENDTYLEGCDYEHY